MRTLLLAVVGLVLATGAARADIFVMIDTPCSHIYGPRTSVIRTDAELESAWLDLGMAGPKPRVDFDAWTIVVHYAGARPTSGHWLNFSSYDVEDGVLRIGLDEIMPETTPCTMDEPPGRPTFPAIAFLVPAQYRDIRVVATARIASY